MKPLIILIKTLIIGFLWSIIFTDGLRVVFLVNWHFDIFMGTHWELLSEKWNSGAPISKSELGFFLILASAFPLWLAGWVGLCVVKWEKIIKTIFFCPVYLYRKLRLKTKPPIVIKKKSVSEDSTIVKKTSTVKKAPVKRPALPSATLMQSNIHNNLSGTSSSAPSSSYGVKKTATETPINHALFNFDDDDFDLDFDFDKKETEKESESIPSALVVDEDVKQDKIKEIENAEKIKEKNSSTRISEQTNKKNRKQTETPQPVRESHTPVLDVLTQKGYDIIPSAIIKNVTVDYVAVSQNQLILCLVDKEVGDWLADEEKFNDEEPLWFSESTHRISPIRKLDIAREVLTTKLAMTEMNFELVSYMIIQAGNIINAEDMFDIWREMNINVTRINRGSPKEIRLFSKSIEPCEEKTDKNTLEKLRKLIRSLA